MHTICICWRIKKLMIILQCLQTIFYSHHFYLWTLSLFYFSSYIRMSFKWSSFQLVSCSCIPSLWLYASYDLFENIRIIFLNLLDAKKPVIINQLSTISMTCQISSILIGVGMMKTTEDGYNALSRWIDKVFLLTQGLSEGMSFTLSLGGSLYTGLTVLHREIQKQAPERERSSDSPSGQVRLLLLEDTGDKRGQATPR